jgi:hypothetical protein
MVSTRSSSYSLSSSSSSSSSSSALHGGVTSKSKRTTTSSASSTAPIYTQSAKDAAIRTYKILHSTFPKSNQNTTSSRQQHPPALRRSNRVRPIVNYNEDNDEDFASAQVSSPFSSSSKKTEVRFAQHQQPLTTRNNHYYGDNDYSESVDDESSEIDSGDYSVDEAANTLANLSSFCNPCINPITPCFHYVYRFQVTDPECKQHYTTCYILYDESSRRFHIHNNNTLIAVKQTATEETVATSSRSACIQPSLNYASPREHSFITKYITFMVDCVEKYIHNILIHDSAPILITSMFFGLVISDNSKYRKLFETDTTFYDIDALNYSTTSTQTTTGHELFMLTPPTYYTKNTFNGPYIQDVCSVISGQAF